MNQNLKISELRNKGRFFTKEDLSRYVYNIITTKLSNLDILIEPFAGEGSLIRPFIDQNQRIIANDIVKNEEIAKLLGDPSQPLFNRVTGGAFFPGSVYKPVVAVAALEEGDVDGNYVFDDPGILTIETVYGKFTYANWYFTQYGGKEGQIGLVTAIKRSTDTFFYKLGELVGVDKLVEWSSLFGLDEPTGVDLTGEIAGLVPSPEWKLEVRGERWFLGNTYHLSIGQGDIALTPIGVNTAIAAIGANGKLCTPHIIALQGSDNFPLVRRKPSPRVLRLPESETGSVASFQCNDIGISKQSIDLVKEGMRQACRPGGTGFTFFDFEEKVGTQVACKTGTAETGDGKTTHAWFVAFAPVDFPEIVATVLVEKGGEGSSVAGPIAREIFDYWFVERRE
ncbi:MAG: penicillin-binding transpeptidase domain-containing protein [Patescibacteria group bacterium]